MTDKLPPGQLACGCYEIKSTQLFDSSMSALPILVMYKLLRVGLFTRIRDRELGLDRREPGLFYPTGYSIMIVV